MRRFLFAGLLMLLALVSCKPKVSSGRDTILLVKSIAADTDGEEHSLLAGFSKVPASGDIYIIGGPRECSLISERFLDCDVRENARGREWEDGLKDFAGETFASICDASFTPYAVFAGKYGRDTLRELSVRLALSALSPKCSVSIYDLDGNHAKTPAKIIILADPWLLECGKFDIDTLFSLTSCKVPVLSPQDLLLEAALGGPKKYFNTGIICDSCHISSGIYPTLFAAKARQYDVLGARCFTAASRSGGNVLAGFLDDYMLAGNSEPIDALLVDDWSLEIGELEKEIQSIRDFNREEYMRYGKLLSPEFKLISSSSITMAGCYGLLRELKLFTNRIAQPSACTYVVKPRPDADDAQFLLIPSENVQD